MDTKTFHGNKDWAKKFKEEALKEEALASEETRLGLVQELQATVASVVRKLGQLDELYRPNFNGKTEEWQTEQTRKVKKRTTEQQNRVTETTTLIGKLEVDIPRFWDIDGRSAASVGALCSTCIRNIDALTALVLADIRTEEFDVRAEDSQKVDFGDVRRILAGIVSLTESERVHWGTVESQLGNIDLACMTSLLARLKDSAAGLDHLGFFLDPEYRDDASRNIFGISKDVSLTYEGEYRNDDRETAVTWVKRRPGDLKARLEKECGTILTVTYGNPGTLYYSTITDAANPEIQDDMQSLQNIIEQGPTNTTKILVKNRQWRNAGNQWSYTPLFPTVCNPSSVD
jgi:hypothetical protein